MQTYIDRVVDLRSIANYNTSANLFTADSILFDLLSTADSTLLHPLLLLAHYFIHYLLLIAHYFIRYLLMIVHYHLVHNICTNLL